jgi:peptidoglycan-associated lipoprotein
VGLPGVGTGALGDAGDPRSPAYFSRRSGDRVFFVVDQSTLTPQAIQTLDGQAQWLLTNADYLALIEGHADEQGTREYNVAWAPGAPTRCASTSSRAGCPANRIRTISYGKERPGPSARRELLHAEPPGRDGDLGRLPVWIAA